MLNSLCYSYDYLSGRNGVYNPKTQCKNPFYGLFSKYWAFKVILKAFFDKQLIAKNKIWLVLQIALNISIIHMSCKNSWFYTCNGVAKNACDIFLFKQCNESLKVFAPTKKNDFSDLEYQVIEMKTIKTF